VYVTVIVAERAPSPAAAGVSVTLTEQLWFIATGTGAAAVPQLLLE
jgi:hypothetical protein